MTTPPNQNAYDFIYRPNRSAKCPLCGSPETRLKNHGKRLGGALGTCAGVFSAMAGTKKGASIGAFMGFRAMASSTPLNGVSAAVLGALAGGAVGCAAGAALGQAVDETILNNHMCRTCGHTFHTS